MPGLEVPLRAACCFTSRHWTAPIALVDCQRLPASTFQCSSSVAKSMRIDLSDLPAVQTKTKFAVVFSGPTRNPFLQGFHRVHVERRDAKRPITFSTDNSEEYRTSSAPARTGAHRSAARGWATQGQHRVACLHTRCGRLLSIGTNDAPTKAPSQSSRARQRNSLRAERCKRTG